MITINKKDLEHIAIETMQLDDCQGRGVSLQVAVNVVTGKLYTEWHVGDNWTVWGDDILTVCHYVTSQDIDHIRRDINNALTIYNRARARAGE